MTVDASSSTSTFAAAARQRVRAALELAATRSTENAARIAAELSSLATEAAILGLVSIAELARRGSEQAQRVDSEHSAVTTCARTLRELARALEAVEREVPRAKSVTERPRGRGRVLVIDDSALNAAVVCDALERAMFETRLAADGDAATAIVSEFRPDVVLADVHMPGSTPEALCARLRATGGARTLQVLLFSGLPDGALAPIAQESGADGFVSKDHGVGAVVDAVNGAYRRSRK